MLTDDQLGSLPLVDKVLRVPAIVVLGRLPWRSAELALGEVKLLGGVPDVRRREDWSKEASARVDLSRRMKRQHLRRGKRWL